MSNPFSLLGGGSDSDNSDVDDIVIEKSITVVKDIIKLPRQYGGSYVTRSDPMVFNGNNIECDEEGIMKLGFSDEELISCVKVVTILGKNPNLFKLPQLRNLRGALHPLIVEQMNKNYDTKGKGDNSNRNRNKRRRDGTIDIDEYNEQRKKDMEEEYINQTQLRALRVKSLESLNSEGFNVPRVPDGIAICDGDDGRDNGRMIGLLTDGIIEIKNKKSNGNGENEPAATHLRVPISCYICKKPYRSLHFFYDQLCPDCATFNYSKRNESVDMKGKVCIVTGGRTKIGYRAVLKLLRCNAQVIATTRFPVDAAQRFKDEKDSANWIQNLHVYGLDFRDIASLETFLNFVIATYDRLDVIINNACQTVRRPPAYYTHLIENEEKYTKKDFTNLDSSLKSMLCNGINLNLKRSAQNNLIRDSSSSSSNSSSNSSNNNNSNSNSSLSMQPNSNIYTTNISSSDMTQIQIAPGDDNFDSNLFPTGATDVNGQQIDLRKENSWTMRLHEVSTPELAEVFLINTIAPTIINARLKKLMEKDMKAMKFIVNVSAMEGKFYRYKNETHPHTNMAKAALNMMTRTSAQDYVKSNIYMTAVDTGWINDEKPIELAVNHEKQHKFMTPLDEIDAASRILDPVIAPLLAHSKGEICEPPFGLFLKDYLKCEW